MGKTIYDSKNNIETKFSCNGCNITTTAFKGKLVCPYFYKKQFQGGNVDYILTTNGRKLYFECTNPDKYKK